MCLKNKLYRVFNSFLRRETPHWLPFHERVEIDQHFTLDIVPTRQGVFIPLLGSVPAKTNIYVKAFGRLTSQ
jgi:hypothetical protein